MKINVIITAGGVSRRFGNENKLFASCGSSCVLLESIKPFLNFKEISKVIVGINSYFSDEFTDLLDRYGLKDEKRIVLSLGGGSRAQTVRNTLSSIDDDAELILIHDGARPFVDEELISAVIDKGNEFGVALPLAPLVDAVVSVEGGINPVDRNSLRSVQTPFAVRRGIFFDAYSNAPKEAFSANSAFYDDLSVIKTRYNGKIGIVEGNPKNIKITYLKDLENSDPFRVVTGCGYDIHRVKQGNGIKLLGVFIPCEYSFIAHSDGDVPVHAIMDGVLSAVGEKDIGHLFPVDDPKYDDADSAELLAQVLKIADGKGFKLSALSVSIIAERPMLAPYIDDMQRRMSVLCNLPKERIGISATTNEQVGDIGNGNAVAAYATVTLVKK